MPQALYIEPGDCIVIDGTAWGVLRVEKLNVWEWHRQVPPPNHPPSLVKFELRDLANMAHTLNAFRGWHEEVAHFGRCDLDALMRGRYVVEDVIDGCHPAAAATA